MFFGKPKQVEPSPGSSNAAETITAMVCADGLLRPLIKVTAVSEVITNYFQNPGKRALPAHKRPDGSVADLWRDIRIEALRHLWSVGKSDPGILAEPTKQLMMLAYLYKSEIYLKHFAPTGDPMKDSLQSVFQVILFLSDVGTEVGCKQTSRIWLKAQNTHIYNDFLGRGEQLGAAWLNFETALKDKSRTLPPLPQTIFEALFDDVTGKTKSIALTIKFGADFAEHAHANQLLQGFLRLTDPDQLDA